MAEGMSFRTFVSETEVEEKRKKRQDEWEKVRTNEQPEECPEEEYDPRSLYDQLQEQKDKKQEEYDDKFKFKNMIYQGLDDDESKFLDHVSQRQIQIEKHRLSEEEAVLQEYKESVTSSVIVKEKVTPASKPAERGAIVGGNRKSQMALLAGAVKRKLSSSEESPEKKRKASASSSQEKEESTLPDNQSSEQSDSTPKDKDVAKPSKQSPGQSRISVIGILPGLGVYSESSDSESSSSDSEVVMLSNVIDGLKRE